MTTSRPPVTIRSKAGFLLTLCVVALPLAAPLGAQSRAKLKSELRKMESAAKNDVAGLLAAAAWAKENGLGADAKRIYQQVLRLDPDNETANLGVGNEFYEGKWMPADKAEKLRAKAREAEFKAAGLVEVDGVWVEKEHVADAKKGIFHHEGDLVTKEEKLALQSGKVRHPVTGELIPREDLPKAMADRYPVGTEGRWGSEEDADAWHANPARPWILRTHYANLVSTLPLKTLAELKLEVDSAIERVLPFLASRRPTPSNRPVVFVAASEDQYKGFGNSVGDEGSTFGAFLAVQPIEIEGLGSVRPAFSAWHKDWGKYYARHAAGMAYLHGVCADIGAEVPLWFLRAFGAYASRFQNNYVAGYFGEQHIQKGGVKDLSSFFSSFAINGEMEPRQIDYNIYQAGLMLSFATQGGDKRVTEAMMDITGLFEKGKGKSVDKAIAKLEKLLIAKEDAIRVHLQKLVQNKDR